LIKSTALLKAQNIRPFQNNEHEKGYPSAEIYRTLPIVGLCSPILPHLFTVFLLEAITGCPPDEKSDDDEK
jgi:hypothetical protein